MIASPHGGVNIEEVAKRSPSYIFRDPVDITVGGWGTLVSLGEGLLAHNPLMCHNIVDMVDVGGATCQLLYNVWGCLPAASCT